jgi:hypothetical protein
MTQAEILAENAPVSTNPFPPSAVARLTGGLELLTIQTEAVNLAGSQVEDDLGRPPVEDNVASDKGGRVLAIIGEYGTGKPISS